MTKFASRTKVSHGIQHTKMFKLFFNNGLTWRLMVVVAVVSLFTANLVILNTASVRGYQMKTLQKNIDTLRKDNQALNLDVSNLSSPQLLEESAKQLGMVPVKDVVYLSPTSEAVAAR